MPFRQDVVEQTRRHVRRELPRSLSSLRWLSRRGSHGTHLQLPRRPDEIRGCSRLDSRHIRNFKVSTDTEASLEQFIRQQTIAIIRRLLLSTPNDNDQARRQRLPELLADGEAEETNSWDRGAQEAIRAIRRRSRP
jgi:hypothetical protein